MKVTPLKRIRLSHYMTQKDVAAKVGVSQPHYHRWECGAAPIPQSQLKQLAKALHTSVDEILGKPRPFDLFGVKAGMAPASILAR